MRGKMVSVKFLDVNIFVLLCISSILFTLSCKKKTEETVGEEQTKEVQDKRKTEEVISRELGDGQAFDLSEVSIFDLSQIFMSRYFLRGQSAYCKDRPDKFPPVKYPRFKSKKPLYGSVHFDGASTKSKGRGMFHFLLDESAGTGKGYNRLYLDHNCNLSLKKEKPLKPVKSPLNEALTEYSFLEQEVYFESFELTFDFVNAGKRTVEIIPRLRIYQGGRSDLSFTATKARKGEIEINGAMYYVLLGYENYIGRPFNQTGTSFYLIPKKESQRITIWSGGDKKAMYAIGGKYYRFTTTPTGDKLFAHPYKGPLGTFEVGAGGRNVQEIAIQGSLRSEETAVAVGGELERSWPKPARSCRIPVADYLPTMLTVTLGRLRISISENYHTDGQPRGKDFNNRTYGIEVRKDKPFVFDLSNKPEVIFASPVRNHRIKLGEVLNVKAVLIDPELDIMIRNLDDTTQKQKKEYASPDGEKHTYERNLSLDPKVIITRADDEKVAEGVMPFG